MTPNPWLLAAALLALVAALSWALSAESDEQVTHDEWQEELDYQQYLRTTALWRDKEAWRALGRPRRDPSETAR